MSGSRKLELTIVSAENLPDVRKILSTTAYATVSVDGSTRRTFVDWEGETDPIWNSDFVFSVKESCLDRAGADVVVNLFCERTMGDRFIGQVRVPVKNLFENRLRSEKKSVTYPVAGTPYGKLKIRYCFEEKPLKVDYVWLPPPPIKLEFQRPVIMPPPPPIKLEFQRPVIPPPPPPIKLEFQRLVIPPPPIKMEFQRLVIPPPAPPLRREIVETRMMMQTAKTTKYVEKI